MGHSS
jgi:leucine-zipper-like transcriptional regulator 1